MEEIEQRLAVLTGQLRAINTVLVSVIQALPTADRYQVGVHILEAQIEAQIEDASAETPAIEAENRDLILQAYSDLTRAPGV